MKKSVFAGWRFAVLAVSVAWLGGSWLVEKRLFMRLRFPLWIGSVAGLARGYGGAVLGRSRCFGRCVLRGF